MSGLLHRPFGRRVGDERPRMILLWLGVVGHEGSTVIVVLNGPRRLRSLD